MQCPECQYENPDNSRFCGECGASLVREFRCSSCGHSNPGGQKFCNGCGASLAASGKPQGASPPRSLDQGGVEGQRSKVERARPSASSTLRPFDPSTVSRSYTPRHLAEKILTSRSALEGERKQVTVLFADVKGSMELAEQLDPEEWHAILDRFFQTLTDGVHRFEGTVNQYTGDGIMALFGAPIAHEDHAQRACHAALWLQEALAASAREVKREHGVGLETRMGLNSGEVVVGRIGDDLRMDYTAQGHTVGLAQRMESLAEPGTCCMSETTARLVSGFFVLDDRGEFSVKGVSDPVKVFELRGPGRLRTRLDVARTRGLTPFVGRETDLQALETALNQACAGDGQVVGVVAEAGVGKSRLCLEFIERCRARGISVNEGHCPAHGKTVPYLPLLEALRSIFGITEQDGDAEARRKVADELLLLDESFREVLPLVSEFLGVADPEGPTVRFGPEVRQRKLVAFIRQLVRARAEREPRVLVIDDAHWIDNGSDAFLAQAVEAVSGTRTLLLVNFRPEYRAEWMSRPYYRQLPLRPLGREATAELLAELLGGDPSLAGLSERIHERTQGNPFFIEEVVLSLVESGFLEGIKAYRLGAPVAELDIPGTVQAVLAARIDRLAEREKQLLQMASVIGKEVPEPLLEQVAGLPEAERAASLAALVQGEFLVEKSLYPQAEYAFKHPLTHEVAYGSQLAAKRAATHAAVARTIEALHSDKLGEQAALLAYHWEQTGNALEAGRWNVRAGTWAGESDPLAALQHMWKGKTFLAEAGETDERAQLELEVCTRLLAFLAWMGAAEEVIVPIFERGRELAEARGDRRSLSQLHLHYGIWCNHDRKDIAACAKHVREAADLAEQVGDEGVALAAAAGLALVAWCEGRVHDAIAVGRRALPTEPEDLMLGSEYWWPAPVVWLTGFTRCHEGWAGRPSEGLAGLERPFELARSQGSVLAELILCLWAITLAELLGDAACAMVHARRLRKTSEMFDKPEAASSLIHLMIGVAHQLAGESREAAGCLERAVAIEEDTGGGPTDVSISWSRLAVAYADLGQSERALEMAVRGLELVRQRQFPVGVTMALTMQSQVLRKTQGADARVAIESALTEAEALVARTGIRSWQPFIHVERAELARLLGDQAGCEGEFREAHRLFTEMSAIGHADRIAEQLRR